MKRAVVFAVILISAPLCFATTIRVPSDRPTIQAGIDAAVDGDTILVATGVYKESIDFRGKGVVVTSEGGPKVTFLNPSSSPTVSFVSVEPSGAELSGFTFSSAEGYMHLKITNGARPLIQGNVFANQRRGDLLIWCSGAHPRIVRNLFFDNVKDYGCIFVYSGAADIINNTFDRNSGGFISEYYTYGATVAKNNIVTNSKGYGVYGTFSELTYNDVWNNNPNYGGDVAGIGSLSVDPLYWDTAAGDYRPWTTSPCVNSGDPNSLYNDSDGTRNDMGAFAGRFSLPICGMVNYGDSCIGRIVATLTPEIRWTYFDTSTTLQEAFELQVGTNRDWTAAELWNSGVVASPSTQVTYSGSPLIDDSTFYLRLKVYNGSSWGEWYEDYFHVHITKTIHVPADWPSIQAAIDAAVTGDTVLVSRGTYSGKVDFLGKGVLLKAEEGAAQTVIQNSSVMFKSGEDTSSVIDGFSIVGASRGIHISQSGPIVRNCDISECSDGDGAGMYVVQSRAKIRDNVIHNNNGWPTGGGICVSAGEPGLEISSNTIFNNVAPHGSGIGVLDGGSARIDHNLIYGNTGESNLGGGIYVNWCPGCEILNNTIIGNTNGLAYYAPASMVVRNNIIVANPGVGIRDGQSSGPYFDHNDIWANGSGNFPGADGISADPLFCDTAAGDFHLQANSPCAPANNSCGVLIGAFPVACAWDCGDIDGSGGVNVTDAARLIYYLFADGPEPLDRVSGDVNQDGRLNIADIVYLVNYVFSNGPAPCAIGG